MSYCCSFFLVEPFLQPWSGIWLACKCQSFCGHQGRFGSPLDAREILVPLVELWNMAHFADHEPYINLLTVNGCKWFIVIIPCHGYGHVDFPEDSPPGAVFYDPAVGALHRQLHAAKGRWRRWRRQDPRPSSDGAVLEISARHSRPGGIWCDRKPWGLFGNSPKLGGWICCASHGSII